MALYRRGGKDGVWWFNGTWEGQRYQVSAKTKSRKLAIQIEKTYVANLAQGRVGIVKRSAVPTLAEFIADRVKPWVKANFERQSPNTFRSWYGSRLRSLARHQPLAGKPLDEITAEDAASFAALMQGRGLKPSSINTTLRLLRRVLKLAVEWNVISSTPKIKLLRGEGHREHVIGPHEAAAYLAAAQEPLCSVALMLFDSGMRPEECYRLRWENLRWDAGRHGSWLITHGKTAAARRVLPMTARVREMLERRWNAAGRPLEGWIFIAPTASGHVEASSIRKLHARAIQASDVRPFVPYSIRHTFLTWLGERGVDVWTLARIAGHSSIAMSARYVHPGDVAVLDAIQRIAQPTGQPKPTVKALPATLSATSPETAQDENVATA